MYQKPKPIATELQKDLAESRSMIRQISCLNRNKTVTTLTNTMVKLVVEWLVNRCN